MPCEGTGFQDRKISEEAVKKQKTKQDKTNQKKHQSQEAEI